MRLHSNIGQDTVLRVEKFTEALKKHHVTWKFALIFVLDTEKHVIVLSFLNRLILRVP